MNRALRYVFLPAFCLGLTLFRLHAQTVYFPPDAFAQDSKTDEFTAQWFSEQLHALQEPSLLESSKSRAVQSYRFFWLRTFHHPISIRADINPDGTGTLTVKVTSGAGGYEPGDLVTNRTQPLSKEDITKLLDVIRDSKFLSLDAYITPDKNTVNLDGSQWVIESADKGTYHIVTRWSPKGGPIYDLGRFFLFELAHMEVPKGEMY